MQVFDMIIMRRQRKRQMMRETESPVAGNGNEFMNLKKKRVDVEEAIKCWNNSNRYCTLLYEKLDL